MATQDYYQKYMNEIVGGMMPNLNRQKKGMYDFMLSQGLRTGQPAAQIAQGMRPYADAAGDAAAKAGVTATKMAADQKRFDVGQANWEKKFAQGQSNWQAAFDQRNDDQDLANMMAMFSHTGWTPELLDAMGYSGLDKARMLKMNRQIGDIGFKQPDSFGSDGTGSNNLRLGRNHPLRQNTPGMFYG